MEKKELLRWDQDEVGAEEEEEVTLHKRSSKATKQVKRNRKNKSNGHSNSHTPVTNVVEKSDLGDDQERSEQQLVASNNGVEEEERTEESVEKLLASINEFEEGIEPKEELVKQLVASTNGVEETEAKEESVKEILGSNNGVEEGTEPKEELVSEILGSNNGVEEETEAKEELVNEILGSNNGVEEGTEPKEELQKLLASTNGVEKKKEPKEESVKKLLPSNNGVEEETKESVKQLVASTNGVEKKKEPKEESVQQFVGSNNGVEEGTEPKEGSAQQLVTSTDEIKESTKAEEIPSRSGHCIYFDKDEDSKFTSIPIIKERIERNTGDEEIQESPALVLQHNGYLKGDNFTSSSVQPSEYLFEEQSIVNKSSAIDEIESADIDLINESETDTKDFDVENVLQKQNTHDLYCPNCNSCITKRVILRKRKRKIRVPGEDVKRNKLDVVVDSKVNASRPQETTDQVRGGADSSLDGTPPLAADDYHPDREPEMFRCLSCFSIFIPTGKFWIFGEKGDKENTKVESATRTNKNWFSIFALDKGKASVEQGSSTGANAVKSDAGAGVSSANFQDQGTQSLIIKESAPPAYSNSETTKEAGVNHLGAENQEEKMNGKLVIDTVGESENAVKSAKGGATLDNIEVDSNNQPSSSAFSKEVQGNDGIQVSDEHLVRNTLPASQQNEINILITSSKDEYITYEKSETDQKSDAAILNQGSDDKPHLSLATTASVLRGLGGIRKPKNLTDIPQEREQDIKAMLLTESLEENSDKRFQFNSNKDDAHSYEFSQHTITNTKLEIHSMEPFIGDEDSLISSIKDAFSIHETPSTVANISTEAAAATITGKDTVITVDAGHEITEITSPNVDTEIHLVERQGSDAAEVYRIEIIKSIIFGGLAETVTSLSVVSSAAGGDTATLNIVALGMASMIGGLFIIFHNLWELKKDRFEQATNQIMENQLDRYRKLLGRRENFILHAVVAVLSYIIFGLVSPIVYGFSFRKSDDRELKLVAIAAASLLCILVLATGKAYVQRAPKPYLKTITTYILLGFTVSGVSYAAGILVKRLLEKLGLFQSSPTVDLLLPEMTTGAAWAYS